jgi:eukaryotic-like serine/threonine-protein kinase
MTTDTEKVAEILCEAVEIDSAGERSLFLDEACAGDKQLRAHVEQLIGNHLAAGSFMEHPAVEDAATALLAGATDAGDGNDTDDIPLNFLEPPTREGTLGRLGHYEVLECLGRGAFGIVLKAFDESLQRVVAVKVLSPELATTSPARKRFLREALAAAKVRHENVVQIYAVEEQPLPYLVMEYIPGETLQDRLDRTGPLEVPDVLRLGHQIARGLAAAHGQGLIHRDIKPGNILLESGPEERVKITDFGLARAADDASLTQSGFVAGTPMFMAPEQARGESIDQRADLFSLGSVLYTMVSGRPPFRASNTVAVLKRVCDDTPRPIPELIPETPAWLIDIIEKLHAKQPEERIQSATEVASLLGSHLAQLQHREWCHSRPMPLLHAAGNRNSGDAHNGWLRPACCWRCLRAWG